MSETGISRLRILELIGEGVLSAEAGAALLRELGRSSGRTVAPSRDVAVIGMSGRFPDAAGLDELWANLAAGRDSVREIPTRRWDVGEHWSPDPLTPDKTYSKWGAILDDIDLFDPDFFSMSPREARLMDPQQRVFLMEAWRALEDAGYSDRALDGLECSIFVGTSTGDYHHLLRQHGVPLEGYTFMGTHPAVLASRISYHLNLTGPSLALDTSCSSSLMAVHLACEALREGRTDLALAGGVAVLVTPELHVLASKAGMLSATGRCRAFDDGADGFVPGEGVGAVVLKRLDRALADGDPVHGVISATASNQDGKTNGITAPSGPAQTALEVQTYERFGIDPRSITYVECHGTGTRLGDPIEIDALRAAFGRFTDREQYCAVGSVKSNFGHTLTAAGIAGLLKTLLCLKHGKLVPTLHVERINRHLKLDDGPFYVNTELRDWPAAADAPRTAAVSSFGFSGTNVHAVVREAPQLPPRPPEPALRPRLIPVSAKTGEALERRLEDLAGWLAQRGARHDWRDIAHTLAVGRSHFPRRAAFVARDAAELRRRIGDWLAGQRDGAVHEESPAPELAGLAAAYRAGGEVDWPKLFAGEPCRRISLPTYPFARESYWVPEVGTEAAPAAKRPPAARALAPGEERIFPRRLRPEQPLVRDHVVLGKPLLPAAGHLAMVHEALREVLGKEPVILSRAVWLRPVFVEEPVELSIAVRGEEGGLLAFEVRTVGPDGQVQVHSRGQARRGSGGAAAVALEEIRGRCPRRVEASAHYDRFTRAGILYGGSFQTVREIHHGDTEVLAVLRQDHPSEILAAPVFDGAVQSVAVLHQDRPGERPHVPFAMDEIHLLRPLPAESFAHVTQLAPGSCRLAIVDGEGSPCIVVEGLSYREIKNPVETRLYLPEWRRLEASALPAASSAVSPVLVAASPEAAGLAESLARRHGGSALLELPLAGEEAAAAAVRSALAGAGESGPRGSMPRIYFLGGLVAGDAGLPSATAIAASQETGVLSLFRLIRALLAAGWGKRELELKIVTRDVHAVLSEDVPLPHAAALFGLAKSLAKEHPSWRVSCCDVSSRDLAGDAAAVAAAVAAEPPHPKGDEVALRGAERWQRVLRPAEIPPVERSPFRKRGTYLILGGAGGIGTELALHLARTVQARLVLLGRRPASPETDEKTAAVEAAGGEALYLPVDAADEAALAAAVAAAKERFGALHGAFHSALVLRDGLLEGMDEATFRAALAPKVEGAAALARVLRGEALDFLVLFSSAQSFSGNAGQSNYSAACTFKDALGESLRHAGLPVHIVNWGYWGEVGIVAKAGFRRRMRALGVHSIRSEEGMDAVERLLAHRIPQAMPLKAEPRVLGEFGVVPDRGAAAAPGEAPAWDPLAGRPLPPLDAERLRRAHRELDALGARMTVRALQEMGALCRGGEEHSTESLIQGLSIVPEHRKLFAALLEILAAEGWVEGGGGRWRSLPTVETLAERDLEGERGELAERYPEIRAHGGLLAACVREYPRLLRGETAPTEVLFPHSSMELVEGVYRGDPLADHLNETAAQAVRAHVERRLGTGGGPVRILEVGAGTGGTSTRVLEALAPLGDRLEYVYTDLSLGFLRHGKRRFGAAHPYLEVQRLDIEQDPMEQGFEEGRFDVVVAANVLHATRRLGTTLAHVRRLLAAGGRLVLSETTAFSPFATMTFGLLDGWWRWEDGEDRIPGSPLAAPGTWRRLLLQRGFARVASLEPGGASADPLGQQVLVAECETAGIHAGPASAGASDTADAADAGAASEVVAPPPPPPDAAVERPARIWVEGVVAECIAATLGRSDADLDPERPFTEYGVDSIILVELVNTLNERLGISLGTTALFDHPSLGQLAQHIWEEFGDALEGPAELPAAPAERASADLPPPETALSEAAPPEAPRPGIAAADRPATDTPAGETAEAKPRTAAGPAPEFGAPRRRKVAVIGLSARYAGARTARELWRNLAFGVCSIREVPSERWDAERYYDPDPRQPGKSNSRWGGFLDDVDAFDPLFFNLSGREAELMDPQQRLFLEGCWVALEDAGYASDAVSGLRCGVFAGAPGSEYGSESHRSGDAADAQVLMGNDSAILAARISYLLNLRGPSIALNTACSSSLVAIHLACQAIASGQCEMALAGGVCLFITPGFYISASKAGMLSPQGLCRTFDHGADGFVPGEGAGVVVLKDLEAAERDGDHIYGVVLGVDTNQDGKSNGITAPSSHAQTDVQLSVYRQAGIDPETLSLIEAHGTGTQLGDPIEIEALSRSFAESTGRKQFCAIGSVKTNIGHTGQAAGAAGLIKVLLAFEHELIPASLHFERENPRIAFADTPFFVTDTPRPWPRRPGVPRRAAVSSYGYSGTNAHLVVEEPPVPTAAGEDAGLPRLALVSAKTPEALHQRLADLDAWLATQGSRRRLADIAFTLHAGRKHFGERAAFVVRDPRELRIAIREALDRPDREEPGPERLKAVEKAQETERLRRQLSTAGLDGEAGLTALRRAAELYRRGLDLPVEWLFADGRGRRIPMPAYPFARDRYWIGDRTLPAPVPSPAATATDSGVGRPGPAHRLLTEELPAETGRRYRFRPRGDEPLVTDHIVGGRAILAAAVSLEMARAAGESVRGAGVTQLCSVTWARPLPGRSEAGLEIRLHADGDALRFEIDAAPEEGQAPAVAGRLRFDDPAGAPPEPELDLAAVRRRLPHQLSGDACYARFREIGFDYGPGFRVVRELRFGDSEVLARLELPAGLGDASSGLVLHPALLDGAFQSMIALPEAGGGRRESRVPYALESLRLLSPAALPARGAWAYLVRAGEEELDLRITDDAGRVLVAVDRLGVARVPSSGGEILRLRPVWRPSPAPASAPAAGATLIFDLTGDTAEELRARCPEMPVVLAVPGPGLRRRGARDYEIDPGRGEDYEELLAALAAEERPRRILILWGAGAGPLLPAGVADLERSFETVLHVSRALMRARFVGPVSLLHVYPLLGELAPPHLAALGGFAKTLRLEHPDLRLATLGLPAEGGGRVRLAQHWKTLLEEASAGGVEVRRGDGGQRRVKVFEEVHGEPLTVESGSGPGPRLREGGSYLITGGAGGLGLLLARRLARFNAKLLLVGRSALDVPTQAELDRVTAAGATILYEPADVADPAALERAIARGRERHGSLHGVIHAAGALSDGFLLHKTVAGAREVLAAKMDGALHLDRITRDDRLDFMVFFSSVVSVAGNVGQADYAYANAFLDEFAALREGMRREGKRWGKTLSINWPAWEAGGMRGDAGEESRRRDAGLAALGEEEGWKLFEAALGFDGPQLVVVKGEARTVRRLFSRAADEASGGASESASRTQSRAPAQDAGGEGRYIPPGQDRKRAAETYLKDILAAELRVPAARIRAGEALETYGIDSVMVMRLSQRLEQDFGELPKTLFFEYQNLEELAGYFAQRHGGRLAAALGETAGEETSPPPGRSVPELSSRAPGGLVPEEPPPAAPSVRPTREAAARDGAVAIVGVSGRYPMARDLDEFWRNLAAGRDCIREIPPERWSLAGFFDPEKGRPGKSYSKWGGFLGDVDRFDSLFFKIAPKEADMMDPQERLFLETVWRLLEDAGHTRSSLGSRTGVFVGVMYGQYQLLGLADDGRMGVSSYASIANRVSYFFDFRGPSLALDTMCSSSLTALHLACESLRRGECDAAVAGGVNLTLHPQKYLQLSLARFASSDGRCRSFGDGGDGYVPGEGVGAVLLKRLETALADGDTVHAVVRGTAVNHGGKTNGYTVPNPHAQREAVVEALRRAGIDPAHVSYLEAHGTGTSLGDPIEIAALTQAWQELGAPAEAVCPIGSVKSSIGHLESAAGIAAVTKVLLQMRHRTLVPSLHAETLNPNVDFVASPFVVQRQLAEWKRPTAEERDGARELPRIAGVSSFGAGGANAHVLLEEHTEEDAAAAPAAEGGEPQILALSAKSPEQLKVLAGRLAHYLEGLGLAPADRWRRILRDDLLRRAAELLGVRPQDLDPDDDLRECGFDEVSRARLATLVGDVYSLPGELHLPPEADSVSALAALLVGEHEPRLRACFGAAEAPGSASAPPRLADVAFTLQLGREAMEARLAFVASGLGEAVRRLDAFAVGEAAGAVFAGHTRTGDDEKDLAVFEGPAGEEALRALVRDRALERIAQLWAQGAFIDWASLHEGQRRRRISLPGHPFDRQRHWLPWTAVAASAPGPAASTAAAPPEPPTTDLPANDTPGREPHDASAGPPTAVQAGPPAALPADAPADPPTDIEDDQEIAMAPTPPETRGSSMDPDAMRSRLLEDLVPLAAELIGLAPERLDPKVNFGDYGFESVALKDLADKISSRVGVPFSPAQFFERPSLGGVASWLVEEHRQAVEAFCRRDGGAPEQAAATGPADPPPPEVSTADETAAARSAGAGSGALRSAAPGAPRPAAEVFDTESSGLSGAEPIAVIGMSGRFPGTASLSEFWESLRAQKDLITEIPRERWDWRDFDNDELPEEERCKFHWGGFLDDVDTFDARFFGISPGEAEMMDPQQRVFLEIVWEALENAGYRASALARTQVGLFAGVQFNDYLHLLHEAGILNAQSGLGNEHSIVLNRVSYLLDLRGPSEPVDTACSSSLVAVHRAVRSLRSGESRMAVAGGIALNLASHSTVAAGRMGLLSPDGRCKTLDRSANGYVKGEGVGVVVLKPLRQALADGDHVLALIRGTAVNHGGRAASLTAPNSEAQAALIRAVVEEAGVGPETLGYIELHGTGTELGDPVEINGLKSAFRQLAERRGVTLPSRPYCGIGSVKTNIGHLEPASGIAGMIKAILAMQHQTLPGIVHLQELNPYIDLDGSPFFVTKETRPWKRLEDEQGRPLPLRAGVSSFGFGGVNSHVLLEEYRPAPPPPAPVENRIFVFSAKSEDALAAGVRRFLDHLDGWEREGAAPDPADVAFTLQIGREEMEERLACVARDLGELRQGLEAWSRGGAAGEHLHRGKVTGGARNAPETADPTTLARHWVHGGTVEWRRLWSGGRQPRRIPLPTYAFERKRYWFTVPEGAPVLRRGAGGAAPTAVEIEEEILFGKQYVLAELKEILADKLKLDVDEIGADASFQEFGIDSMVSGMIMQAAQERFNSQVPLNALMEHPTLSSLAAYIYEEFLAGDELPGERRVHRRKRSAEQGSSGEKRVQFPPELLPIQTKGHGQPSFWVHGAAGYSAWFQNLSEALGPEFPVYAFQARGTDGYSMPQTLDEMVDHYIHCMRLVQPQGPYFLGGYSFGGLVATEMARRLHEEGETIRHLVLFDTYPAAQEVFDRHFGRYDEDFLQFYLANYFLRIDQNPELAIRKHDVAHLPERLRLAEIAKLVRERGQTRISADEIYKYLRGGLACSEHAEGIYQMYEMRPYDASEVLFFKATDGFTGRASAAYWEPNDILAGYDYPAVWKEYVSRDLRVVKLDNDHLNMLEEPTLTPAARQIEALLREPPPLDMGEYLSFRDAFEKVTRFGHQLLAARFRGSEALPAAGQTLSRGELHDKLGVIPAYDRLFGASVDILEREGYLRREGDQLAVTAELETASFAGGGDEIAARAEALASEHPEIKDYLPLLTVCQGAVLEVMRGSRDATDVIFPGGSMKYVAELYKGNLQTDYYNRLVAERVQEHLRHHVRRYTHSRAQIFEVGAGTGGTSVFVFQALAQYADKVRYLYTDVGSAFLQMSKQQFGAQYPYVEFLGFDVERAPEPQGFEPHTMDVVIASNVLHTTHHIDVTLEQCARLLKPGGVIVINELTQRLDYNTLTFGLTTGWWLYEDEELRIQGSPLLTNVDWARMLKKAGFGEVEIVGVPDVDPNELPQSMIAATKQSPLAAAAATRARKTSEEAPAAEQDRTPHDLVAVEGGSGAEVGDERGVDEERG